MPPAHTHNKEVAGGMIQIPASPSQPSPLGLFWHRAKVFKHIHIGTCYEGKLRVDSGSIPGLGRFLGEGNGNPLQASCLKNPLTEEPGGLQSIGLQESDMT